ncbi:MAG: hypothetical protein FWC76_08685, partial [Defluviitaleaceae bacterium]|nr:hypothetical protein [Defluviitaleaceae bacterium]
MAKNGKQNLKQESKIFGKWIAIARAADKIIDAARADAFRGAKHLVVEKINMACSDDESLPSYDAEIFECYMRIIGAYSDVMNIYLDDEKPITSLPIKEIWDGIYEVLTSRLLMMSEMEDMVKSVQAEKKSIVSKIIDEALVQMDDVVSYDFDNVEVKRRLLDAEDMSFEDFQAICKEISADVANKCINDFYKTYISAVTQVLMSLNDLSGGESASYYNEALKEEQDILRQIIVVQVMALENAVSEGLATENESNVLDEALNLLREAHQRESGEIDRIERLFNENAVHNRENMGRVVMDVEDAEEFA